MNKKLILSLLLITSGIFVNGQENSWSLQKCFDTASQNNIDIKIKQLEINRAKKLYTHPLLELFPTVNLVGNHSYNFGSTIDPSTNNRVSSDIQYDNMSLAANVNLLNFGNLATSQRDKINIELAQADKEVIEYEYKLQLLEKYFDALFSQELVKIQKEQIQNTTFNLERIKKEVEIGNKPESDLYDIQLSFSQDEKGLLEAVQLFETQKLQLFQLMNFAVENLEAVTFEVYLAEETEPVDKSIFKNPKIEYAELSYKRSKKEISILRSDNLPSISGYYSLSTFYSSPINQPNENMPSFKSQFDDNKNHEVGLRLNIPVFNGFKRSRQITASKIEAEKVKLVSEQEKIRIQQQVELETTRKKQYMQLASNLQNTLKYAKESFRTTQAKFTSGKVDAVIYTSVKNQLLSSEYDFLKNNLLVQYASLKINLIQKNEL
ncbi:TolC family protein [Flavobacterium lindanitolerans]|uniref:TolC family protein n=2 Tax=Flavobacterium lindanitolerans TaxID=428988 RepID=UPI002808ED8F|nr:TolC family protein [Flavobacterium lindanitolerans]MDQ7959882.1 TolC family protein [Flavobacterium lindanitolerans]